MTAIGRNLVSSRWFASITTKMNLQHLPTEILLQCFKYESLVDFWETSDYYTTRLKALRLVRRSGNGYNNVTELGRSISLADMIAIDRFYASQERRERYAKRQR